MTDLGEIVDVCTKEFRAEVEARGFTMRGVVALMKSYTLNESYLNHRMKKGSVPINVFRAACEVIGVDFHDYVMVYDLSEVPTYQLEEELDARRS